MHLMGFDLDFEEKLIHSTHLSSRKYVLKEICCFKAYGSTGEKGSKEDWFQVKTKQRFITNDAI